MARKPTTVPLQKQPLELSMSREEAKTRLQDRIEKGLELKKIRSVQMQRSKR